MKVIAGICSAVLLLVSVHGWAKPEEKNISAILQGMIDVNLANEQEFHARVSKDSLIKQTPSSTAVLCSDSRVAIRSLSDSPEGQLFSIRNIGNQVVTAKGSVVYGVEYLHTPLLLIIGHSGCGAVQAALDGYKSNKPALRKELATLRPEATASLNDNIVENVHHQVEFAVELFKSKVDAGEVIVIGLVYDLHNDFGYGHGKLIFVNINNNTDPKVIAAKPYIQGLKNLTVLNQ